jgi:hypothetical protein
MRLKNDVSKGNYLQERLEKSFCLGREHQRVCKNEGWATYVNAETNALIYD